MNSAVSLLAVVGVIGIWLIILQIQARLDRCERKLNALLRHFGLDLSTPSAELSERVKEIARDPARKIEAIKVYREETGATLAEAKNAVEKYVGNP